MCFMIHVLRRQAPIVAVVKCERNIQNSQRICSLVDSLTHLKTPFRYDTI